MKPSLTFPAHRIPATSVLLRHPNPTALVALATFSFVLLVYVKVFLPAGERTECPGSSHFGCLAPNITCASYTCSLTSLRKEPHKLELVASSSYSVLHGLVLQSYPINAWASFCYSWVFFGGFCRYRSASLMGTYRQTQYNSFNLLLFNRVLKMLFCPREFSRAAGAGVGV